VPYPIESCGYKKNVFLRVTVPKTYFFCFESWALFARNTKKMQPFLDKGNAVSLFIICAVPLRRSEKTERNVAR